MEPIVIVAIVAVAILLVVLAVVVSSRRTPKAPTAQGRAPAPAAPSPRALRERLARTRNALAAALGGVFGSATIDDGVWQDIEDALISADVGPSAAMEVVAAVRATRPETGEQARVALEAELTRMLERDDRGLRLSATPSVVVVVGVNGTGKTTSIAKIAKHLADDGKTVVLGAADTYRAAADSQLRAWGERVGVPVVSGGEGTDPASVAYDAYARARSEGADVVIVDTAGRLHSQANLMDELRKVIRVLDREAGGIDEVLLVLDGTVGQNGIVQARSFTEAVGVTGVVLTKLDGTARGGVAIAVETQLDVPVKLIGVGEGMDDLIPFVPGDFVEALLDE